MDPIGASTTWRWYGYENSWVVLDGALVQSVSGGGHWGGGMFINAYDMARYGVLTLRRGKWTDHKLISNQWVQWALMPKPYLPGMGVTRWQLVRAVMVAVGARAVGIARVRISEQSMYRAVDGREAPEPFLREELSALRLLAMSSPSPVAGRLSLGIEECFKQRVAVP